MLILSGADDLFFLIEYFKDVCNVVNCRFCSVYKICKHDCPSLKTLAIIRYTSTSTYNKTLILVNRIDDEQTNKLGLERHISGKS